MGRGNRFQRRRERDRGPGRFPPDPRGRAGPVAAFIAVEPIAGTTGTRAEVSFLGVRPSMWGRGIAELLLRKVRSRLVTAGYAHAELSVYVTNVRAVTLYARLGWKPAGAPAPHRRTGKPEQRYEVAL